MNIAPLFALGDRVRFVEAHDLEGIITSHTNFLDGSERWCVEYWNEGQRKDVTGMAREIVLA